MDLTVLNTDLFPTVVVDTYESFIWTDRYREYGDFELYTTVTEGILNNIKEDYYLQNRESEHVMIVEKLLIKTDVENGNHITITGRSLESILDRRIVWGRIILSGSLQDGIKQLLDECIISPSDEKRKINNFIFEYSTDTAITDLTLDAQYTGDNLYDIIAKICNDNGLGFKVTLNDNKQFVFKLYTGTDRSYDQNENPYVVFSPSFDNLVNSNYIKSKMALKNVTLVGGEGEGTDRRYASVGDSSGLNRRELFTDARDITSDTDGGVTLSEEEYTAQLEHRGKENLANNTEVTSFEGEIDTTLMFKYGEDFFNGDIVQFSNEYGHETKVRILEIVMSENEQGTSLYPTFETIEDKQLTTPDNRLEEGE